MLHMLRYLFNKIMFRDAELNIFLKFVGPNLMIEDNGGNKTIVNKKKVQVVDGPKSMFEIYSLF